VNRGLREGAGHTGPAAEVEVRSLGGRIPEDLGCNAGLDLEEGGAAGPGHMVPEEAGTAFVTKSIRGRVNGQW
jgi:hypothetical protein